MVINRFRTQIREENSGSMVMFVLPRNFILLKEIPVDNVFQHVLKSVSTYCSLCYKDSTSFKPSGRRKWNPHKKFKEFKESPSYVDSACSLGKPLFIDRLPHSKICSKTISEEEILRIHLDKVNGLADYLKCSQDSAVKLLQKYNFLTKLSMDSIIAKIETLIDGGIVKEELLNDLWILTYTIPTIEEKLYLLKVLNLVPIKPWLLRCNADALVRMSKNRESNRLAICPYETVEDYLKERLGLSEAQAEIFSRRHPPVMRVKVAKLKEMIDFLYSEGFTPLHIYNTPRILCHSLATIENRLKKLRALNFEPYTLLLLCKSKRSFERFILSLAKENTHSNS